MTSTAKLITAGEVADVLRCHVMSVYRLAKAGTLPCIRIGSRLRFREDDLVSYIEGSLHSEKSAAKEA
jgi:excisionase family DNA binding protein